MSLECHPMRNQIILTFNLISPICTIALCIIDNPLYFLVWWSWILGTLFFHSISKLSKMELSDSESNGRFTVAFLGPFGTYSHEVSKVSMSLSLEWLTGLQAAYKRFANHAQYLERKTIAGELWRQHSSRIFETLFNQDVFSSLSPSVPLGVVPQENSTFGSVIETCNALRGSHPGFVRGEVLLKIDHCLLVRKGAKLDEIRKVMSHEQVCRILCLLNVERTDDTK